MLYKYVRVLKDGRRVSTFASAPHDTPCKPNQLEHCPHIEYKPNRIVSDVKDGKGIWLENHIYRFTDIANVLNFSGTVECYEVTVPVNSKPRTYGPSIIRVGKLVKTIVFTKEENSWHRKIRKAV